MIQVISDQGLSGHKIAIIDRFVNLVEEFGKLTLLNTSALYNTVLFDIHSSFAVDNKLQIESFFSKRGSMLHSKTETNYKMIIVGL